MTKRDGIVVGIDGSAAAIAAARWAQAHTGAFGPLRPVYAWSVPAMALAGTSLGFTPAPPIPEMQAAAERAASVFAEDIGLAPTAMTTMQGDAGTVLCNIATDANLLVVGTRSRGALRANLLGSVGRACADHADVPLVIVPAVGGARSGDGSSIIVGVDGSANAVAGLRWAADNFPDASITAVASWQTPIDGPVMFGGGRFDVTAFRAQAAAIIDDAVAELGDEGGRIKRKVVEGDPRLTLLGQQAEADLLVVGRRGRGGLAHLVIGSTTTSLIHQPRCPIAVIPSEESHV